MAPQPRNGVVVYIPGISPRHPDLESEEMGSVWAIRLDEPEMLLTTLYLPEQIQPGKSIELVSRGPAPEPLRTDLPIA